MTGRLEGKVALVTGATGGIGQASCAAMLREGARLLAVGRDPARLDQLAKKLDAPGRVETFVGQVAEEADVEAMVAQTVARFGRLDILFANAGAEGRITPLIDLSAQAFDEVQKVNVRGPFLAIKHGARAMMACEAKGSIILTSSVAGVVGVPGLTAYAASKHGLIGIVHVAALELAAAGIRVNAIAPAPIDNNMMKSIEEQAAPGQPEAARAGFSALIAMKRYGTNEEVANLVLFLASDEASFCTGATFPVDGGFLAA